MSEPLRGIYPALQATFDESGELDTASMERQVAHCIEAGTHGIVFPVLAGELKHMTVPERQRFAEVVVGTAAGQVPVVIGCTAPCAEIAVHHARHAAQIGADSIISLPPYPNGGTGEDKRAYYKTVSEAAQVPMFIQDTRSGMSAEFMAGMIRDFEWVQYIKEETPPSGHSISAILDQVGKECLGVMGGAHGTWMIPEMQRGACGFVPAAHVTDIYVQVWDACQAGDVAQAFEIFDSLLPMLNLLRLVGLGLCKEVLVRRGVIASALMRAPGSAKMDAQDEHDLELAMTRMAPYFTV